MLITLTPKPGMNNFYSEATKYNRVLDEAGNQKDVPAGKYTGEYFPRTRQFLRVGFSYIKNTWVTGMTGEELAELFEDIKLTYKRGPYTGTFITSFNLRNDADAFFIHEDLSVALDEGSVVIDTTQPIQYLVYRANLASGIIAEKNREGLYASTVKFIASSKEEDAEMLTKKREVKKEAFRLYDKMSHDKKVKVAMAMNLPVDERTRPDIVDERLFEMLDGPVVLMENGMTNKDWFIELAKMEADKLGVKHAVSKAKNLAIIQKTSEGYKAFGMVLGSNLESVNKFFEDPKNSEILNRLLDTLNE